MGNFKTIFNSIKHCSCCDCKVMTIGYNEEDRIARIMKQKNLCFDCAYWQDIIDYPPQNIEVIRDKCVRILPPQDSKDKSLLLGGKGVMRYFMRDDWSVLCSNDIWTIGTIPERFRPQLQPTVTEITKKAYNRLKRNDKKCKARACMNRYMCFRYDIELEKDNEPYNKVPSTWNPKNERCGSFIDKKEILSDESNADSNN